MKDNLDYQRGYDDGTTAYRRSLLEWVDMWEDHNSEELERFYELLVERLAAPDETPNG